MAVTDSDRQNLSSNQIAALQSYTDQYNKAKAEGNTSAMANAHAQAEKIRNSAGYTSTASGSYAGTYTPPTQKTTSTTTTKPAGATTTSTTPTRKATTIYQFGSNNPMSGYIENGKTYYDDGTRVGYGDAVQAGGEWYYYDPAQGKGVTRNEWESSYGPRDSRVNHAYAENAKGYNEQQQMINDLVARNEELQRQMIEAATQKAVNDQKAVYEDAVSRYNQLISQNAIQSAQAADNLALRNVAAGDQGGIGQKLYSDQQAAYDNRAMSIKLEQTNLKNTVDREVANLRLQGEYEKADVLAQLATMRVNALQGEYDQYISNVITLAQLMEGQRTAATETAYERAANKLQLGFTLTPQEAQALGVDPAEAQAFTDRVNLLAQIDLAAAQGQLAAASGRGSGGGGSSSGGSGGLNTKQAKQAYPYASGPTQQTLIRKEFDDAVGIQGAADTLSPAGQAALYNMVEDGLSAADAQYILDDGARSGKLSTRDATMLGYYFNPTPDTLRDRYANGEFGVPQYAAEPAGNQGLYLSNVGL